MFTLMHLELYNKEHFKLFTLFLDDIENKLISIFSSVASFCMLLKHLKFTYKHRKHIYVCVNMHTYMHRLNIHTYARVCLIKHTN